MRWPATLGEFFAFGQELFEARRAERPPTSRRCSPMRRSTGNPVPFRDFIGNLILVLVGGNETTRNSLSHSIVALSKTPISGRPSARTVTC